MKNLLIVLVLVVAGVAGLGFYLGWFHGTSDSIDGKRHIELTVDQDKIKADEKKAQEKLHGVENYVKGKATTPTETSKGQVSPPPE